MASAFAYLLQDGVERSLIDRLEHGDRTYRRVAANDDNDYFDPSDDTIHWGPYSALRVSDGTQSPALGLGHEIDHAIEDPRTETRLASSFDRQYDTLEERRVITGSERHAVQTLGEDRATVAKDRLTIGIYGLLYSDRPLRFIAVPCVCHGDPICCFWMKRPGSFLEVYCDGGCGKTQSVRRRHTRPATWYVCGQICANRLPSKISGLCGSSNTTLQTDLPVLPLEIRRLKNAKMSSAPVHDVRSR